MMKTVLDRVRDFNVELLVTLLMSIANSLFVTRQPFEGSVIVLLSFVWVPFFVLWALIIGFTIVQRSRL